MGGLVQGRVVEFLLVLVPLVGAVMVDGRVHHDAFEPAPERAQHIGRVVGIVEAAEVAEYLQEAVAGRFHGLVAVAGVALAHAQGQAMKLRIQPAPRHPLLAAEGRQQLGKPGRCRIRWGKVQFRGRQGNGFYSPLGRHQKRVASSTYSLD